MTRNHLESSIEDRPKVLVIAYKMVVTAFHAIMFITIRMMPQSKLITNVSENGLAKMVGLNKTAVTLNDGRADLCTDHNPLETFTHDSEAIMKERVLGCEPYETNQ